MTTWPTTVRVVTLGALLTTGVALAATQLITPASSSTGFASTSAPGQAGKSPEAEPTPKNLTVSSFSVTGLSPGVSIGRSLAIGNPNNQDVALQSVKTTIGGPSPSGACTSPADVEVLVAGYNASTGAGTVVTIPKNSSLTVPVTVRMNDRTVNQDGCKARIFTFTFTATATSK